MPSYELSVEAAADIESIGDYGVSTFGFALFYTISGGNIVIVRVLPASADFKRHFAS